MLILIEGPDCAGKTTLANDVIVTLRKIYPHDRIELLHRGPPTRHPLDEYVTPLLDYRPNQRRHIVCDRWHWGEAVYPHVMGRTTQQDDGVFNYIEMFLASRGALVVPVIPSVSEIRDCIERRGDSVVQPSQALLLVRGFQVVLGRSMLPVLGSTYAHSVIQTAQYFEGRVPTQRFVTPVGSWDSQVVLVGDKRNCRGDPCRHSPSHSRLGTAFMPYPATSGHYLFNALGDRVRDALLVNACEEPQALNHVDHLAIVALGANAHRKLRQLNVPHATVPHPQYIRRFHHRAGDLYRQLILDVIGTERNELKWRPSSLAVTASTSTPASSSEYSRVGASDHPGRS